MTDKIEIRKLNELHKIHKAIENKNCNSNSGNNTDNNQTTDDTQNTNNIDVSTDDGIKKLFEIILTNSPEQSPYNLDYINSSQQNNVFLSDEEILESVEQNQIISIDEISLDTPVNTIFSYNNFNSGNNFISANRNYVRFNYSSTIVIFGVYLFTINDTAFFLLKNVRQAASPA